DGVLVPELLDPLERVGGCGGFGGGLADDEGERRRLLAHDLGEGGGEGVLLVFEEAALERRRAGDLHGPGLDAARGDAGEDAGHARALGAERRDEPRPRLAHALERYAEVLV